MPELDAADVMTGVREIDADIEGLCFLMARIFDPLVECRRCYGPCDHSHCTRINAIRTYVERGFRRQDSLMAAAEYPLSADHQAEHLALLNQLAAMIDAGLCADRDRHVVHDAVCRWVARHNSGFDHLLANWAVTRRVLPPSS